LAWACWRSSGITRGDVLAAGLAGGDFAFGAVETATGLAAGAGAGSEPRRPTLRDSLLRKPSDDSVPALEAVLRGADAGTATIGSLLDDEKMDDSAGSGALGMVACEGTVPGAGP